MTITPVAAVVLFVAIALVRFYDEFAKAAAAEAGKSFGKRVGDLLSRRAESRFGVRGTVGLVLAGLFTVALVSSGVALAFASPDCESQKAGYTLIGGTAGMWI